MIEISSERTGLITNDPSRHFGGKYEGTHDETELFARLVADYMDDPTTFDLHTLQHHKVGLVNIHKAFFWTNEGDNDEYITMITLIDGPTDPDIPYMPEHPYCPECEEIAANYMGGPNYGCDEFDPGPQPCPRHTPEDDAYQAARN